MSDYIEEKEEAELNFHSEAIGAFMKRKFPPPDFVWDDFVAKGDFVCLAGETGIGKTLVTQLSTLNLSQGKEFASLNPKYRRKVFYIDAEMDEGDMQERFKRIPDHKNLSGNFHYMNCLANETALDLTNPDHQEKLLEQLQILGIELLVLDNLFSLSAIKDFRRPEEFIEGLKPFIHRLRREKISCILLLHLNKAGEIYGSIAQIVFVDLVLVLEKDEEDRHSFRVVKNRRMGLETRDLHFAISETNECSSIDPQDFVSKKQYIRYMDNNFHNYYPDRYRTKRKAIEAMNEDYRKRFEHDPFINALSYEKNYAKHWNDEKE
tara:strand:- start:473 stop:1435 length:963 start_codon:yes stop_codon:yes gene_type:complete